MLNGNVNFNSITKDVERLAWHLQSGYQIDSIKFYKLCISLSRGIDYALANVQSPPKAVEQLPMLLKMMHYKRKYDDELAAVMVLMISVKSACESGWFVNKLESKELLTIASEIGKFYYTLGDLITNRPNSINSAILSTIVAKSYPNLKLGAIIVSIEAKPGYGASLVDFIITKNNYVQSAENQKICLLVAQAHNIDTNACLISPQQVSFLLNGKPIDTRSQMPTNVTSMLKPGTNILQVVGQFNGHYIILVAYMNYVDASLPEKHPPSDYVQPNVTSVDSDVTDTVSSVVGLTNKYNQEADGYNLHLMNSVVGEYGSSSSSLRHIHRSLPVQSQTLVGPKKNYSATPYVSLPNLYSSKLSDREREQLFSRPLLNMMPQLPAVVNMSAATQKRAIRSGNVKEFNNSQV